MTNEDKIVVMTTEDSLKQVKYFISKMPNLSTTVAKVMEICNNPSSSPNDLKKVIELDSVLTGQVLKLINSAYYRFPGKSISLTRAIIVLGLNTVKNLALATSLLTTFKAGSNLQGEAVDQFWEHSLRVGVKTKLIADLIQIPAIEQEEYFVAGLLHDLGKLPLMTCFPGLYGQIAHYAVNRNVNSCEAEQYFLNLDHCHVNRLIAVKWKLGDELRNAMEYHHIPFKDLVVAEPLLFSVGLANQTTLNAQMGADGGMLCSIEQVDLLKKHNRLDLQKLLAMQPEIEEQIKKARIFLKIN